MGTHMVAYFCCRTPAACVQPHPRKADALIARGAIWHDTPAMPAAAANVVITIVGFPSDVEDLYLGSGRSLHARGRGAILIDMTTSSPFARQTHRRGGDFAWRVGPRRAGIGRRNRPVTPLSIMVGGDAEAFSAALPILRLMGPNVAVRWSGRVNTQNSATRL
jgi:3-hydroxyisobutyrate dehydrogenase